MWIYICLSVYFFLTFFFPFLRLRNITGWNAFRNAAFVFYQGQKWWCSAISMTTTASIHQHRPNETVTPVFVCLCTVHFRIIVLYDYTMNIVDIFFYSFLLCLADGIGSSKYCDMIQVFLIIINISGAKFNVNLFVWQIYFL